MIASKCRSHLKTIKVALLFIAFSSNFSFCLAETHQKGNTYTEHLETFKNSHNVSSIAWHPDKNLLATGGMSKIVSIWDVEKGKLFKTIDSQAGGVGALAYSPDGKYLAVGRTFTRVIPEKYHINIYDADSGDLIRNFIPPPASKGYSKDIHILTFSPDSKLLAANAYGGQVRGVVYDIDTGEAVTTLTNSVPTRKTDRPTSLSFSPDGNYLAVGHGSGTINIWLKSSWELSSRFLGQENGIYSLSYSPDGNYLAAASRAKNINIWNLREKTLVKTLESNHVGYIRRVQFTPDGNTLISGGSDKSIMLFNVQEPQDKIVLGKFANMAYPYISPRGKYLSIATGSNVELWTLGGR